LFSSSGPPGPDDIRRLYDAAAPLLIRIAVRITGGPESAEDIVHDAFARLVEKGIAFPSMDDAKFWLIRVVKNGALNYAKRKGREAKAYEKWWRGEKDSSGGADEVVLRDESAEELKKGLDALPESLKSVLVLKEYGGLNYKEIGRALGISEGNVKVRAFRAREALLAKLGEGSKHVS
jgi:RNA polymerase sigma factor (sigma-70 family)